MARRAEIWRKSNIPLAIRPHGGDDLSPTLRLESQRDELRPAPCESSVVSLLYLIGWNILAQHHVNDALSRLEAVHGVEGAVLLGKRKQ